MIRQILRSLFLIVAFCAANAFAQSEKPVSYGIFLDTSGSMLPQQENIKIIGKELVAQTYQKGSVSIYSLVSSRGTGEAVFKSLISENQNRAKLEKEIDNLPLGLGQSSLLDAIESAHKKLISKDKKDSQKFLLLVTDGSDTATSSTPQTQIIDRLKESNIKVYIIGLIDSLPTSIELTRLTGKDKKKEKRISQEKATEFLKQIANQTSGRVIFPKAGDNIRNAIKNLLAE